MVSASRLVTRALGVLLLGALASPNIAAAPMPGAALVASKAFSGPTVALGSLTTVTFSVSNNTGSTVTNVNFTDTLPAGLQIASPNGTTISGCSFGSVTAVPGASLITAASMTIPATTTCLIGVNLVGVAAGLQNNTSSAITSSIGGAPAMTASITVVAQPTLSKAFGVASVTTGSGTSLTFTLTNPNTGTALTGVGFTDTFPAGVIVATPNAFTTTCVGGVFTATPGSGSVSVSGTALAANASCTVGLNVTTTSSGSKVNTTTAINSNEAGFGNTATATLTVNAPVPVMGPLMLGLLAVLMLAVAVVLLRRRDVTAA